MDKKKSILFICLGNICRSPMAEAVFVNLLNEREHKNNWEVDSAAIGNWHSGKSPDPRAISVLSKYGITTKHKARQIKKADFQKYDYIMGMDNENISDLKSLRPEGSKATIELLGNHDPVGEKIIRDPYYDRGEDGFEKCYEQCLRCCSAFLSKF